MEDSNLVELLEEWDIDALLEINKMNFDVGKDETYENLQEHLEKSV